MQQKIEYSFRFSIPGQPVGKERSRSGLRKHYTPIKTRTYEYYVGMLAQEALAHLPYNEATNWPTEKQVYLDLWIYHLNGRKPDSDNVVKAIEDGLSGILWKNDRHVLARVQCEFWPEENPRVDVRITFTGYTPTDKGLVKDKWTQ